MLRGRRLKSELPLDGLRNGFGKVAGEQKERGEGWVSEREKKGKTNAKGGVTDSMFFAFNAATDTRPSRVR